ncbi:MAG: aspartate-semialdehyde dehydrogenase [Planctomycetota bacterium]
MTSRIPVGLLGATGSVGQRFVALLQDHPRFELAWVAASERSAGRRYGDAARWVLPTPLPAAAAELEVLSADPAGTPEVPLVLSALDSGPARALERPYARRGSLVVSNASAHRMDRDVPLLVPEVNADHLGLLETQSEAGGLITNPNCSTIGFVLALKPLFDAFGLRTARVVSLQAISGAGLPGVASMTIVDNAIPFIPSEEDKLESEPARILGALEGDEVRPAPLAVSAQCNRVPVIDGHLLSVSVELAADDAAEADLIAAWRGFRGEPQELGLPSAPAEPTIYLDAPDAPQPRMHRELGGGMSCSVGRLRRDPLGGWRFVALVHNTLRGAAGGALLCAELAEARGALPS